jgi:hypothetical protein
MRQFSPESGFGGRNDRLERAIKRPTSRKNIQPGYFPNTYLLGARQRSGTGLVQQTVQIVASHDLTLIVGRSRYAENVKICCWMHYLTFCLARGI